MSGRHNQRSQLPKSRRLAGEAFTLFRRVEQESAEQLHDLIAALKADNVLPPQTEVKPSEDMRVTYIERSRMTRQLQGFAAGFNSAEAVQRINRRCKNSGRTLGVSLGRVGLLDRRDEALIIKLDHSQTVAGEYEEVTSVLRTLHVPGTDKNNFRPHITLAKIPGLASDDKRMIETEVQAVMLDTVMLLPLETFPKNPQARRV